MNNYSTNQIIRFALTLTHNVDFTVTKARLFHNNTLQRDLEVKNSNVEWPFVVVIMKEDMDPGVYRILWEIELENSIVELEDTFTLNQQILEVDIDPTLPKELQYLG